jgi:hypothetical protein
MHGGVCADGINSYSCDCTGTGYSGATCASNIDDCAASPCLHGGTCIDLVNSYECDCTATGYTGADCDILIEYSSSTAADMSSSTGAISSAPSSCDSSPCENGATCASCTATVIDSDDGYRSFVSTPSWYEFANAGNIVSFTTDFTYCYVSINIILLHCFIVLFRCLLFMVEYCC